MVTIWSPINLNLTLDYPWDSRATISIRSNKDMLDYSIEHLTHILHRLPHLLFKLIIKWMVLPLLMSLPIFILLVVILNLLTTMILLVLILLSLFIHFLLLKLVSHQVVIELCFQEFFLAHMARNFRLRSLLHLVHFTLIGLLDIIKLIWIIICILVYLFLGNVMGWHLLFFFVQGGHWSFLRWLILDHNSTFFFFWLFICYFICTNLNVLVHQGHWESMFTVGACFLDSMAVVLHVFDKIICAKLLGTVRTIFSRRFS